MSYRRTWPSLFTSVVRCTDGTRSMSESWSLAATPDERRTSPCADHPPRLPSGSSLGAGVVQGGERTNCQRLCWRPLLCLLREVLHRPRPDPRPSRLSPFKSDIRRTYCGRRTFLGPHAGPLLRPPLTPDGRGQGSSPSFGPTTPNPSPFPSLHRSRRPSGVAGVVSGNTP